MNYKILIIGHSTYPEGARSFLDFFGIPETEVDILNIDNEKTVEELQTNVKNYFDKNQNVIIVADLTGGSPHKAAMEVLHQSGGENHFVISGVPMGALLEIAMKAITIGIQDIEKDLNLAIDASVKSIMLSGTKIEFKKNNQNKPKQTKIIDGI